MVPGVPAARTAVAVALAVSGQAACRLVLAAYMLESLVMLLAVLPLAQVAVTGKSKHRNLDRRLRQALSQPCNSRKTSFVALMNDRSRCRTCPLAHRVYCSSGSVTCLLVLFVE